MKKTTKALALVLCAMLLVVGSVMGTLAYLTSAKEVKNTFTVGNIEIKLDEAIVDNSGEATSGRTEDGNENVKLIPGRTITKDPTVWVKEGSEPAYIRMKVTISHYTELKEIFGDDFLPQNYVTNWDGTTWESTMVVAEDTEEDTATYEFRYKEVYTAVDDNNNDTEDYYALPALFTSFTLPGNEVDNAELAKLEGLSITISAYAIQSETFNNADEAWNAYDNK